MSKPLSNDGGSFAEAHQDFVLKLKFVGQGDASQIRRVRLPRILNGQGGVSYEELVGLAVSFVIPENPRTASDFEVKLTYQDVDDDTVVVGSSEELTDAIDQFSGQRVLRMTAEVKPCTRAKPQQQRPVLPTQQPSTSRASPDRPSGDAASQPNNATGSSSGAAPVTPVLQNVVESVVNIILNAAVAINGRQGSQDAAPFAPVFYTPDGMPAEPPEPEASVSTRAVADDAAVENEQQIDDSPESPSPSKVEQPEGLKLPQGLRLQEPQIDARHHQSERVAIGPAKASAEEPKSEKASAGKPKPDEKTEEKQHFIHGRHTCDGCLTTPIVGKRYHAINMSDYDVCEKCFLNYKGADIQFEAVELDRDRNLQGRWLRKKNRMNRPKRWGPGRHGRPVPVAVRPRPPHRVPGHPPHPPHGQPPPPFHPHRGPRGMRPPHGHLPPPFHPPHRGPRGIPCPPFPMAPLLPPKGSPERLEIEEAYRRSLQDQEKETGATLESNTSAPVEDPSEPSERVVADDGEAERVVSSAEKVVAAASLKPAPKPSAPLEKDVRSLIEKVSTCEISSSVVEVETVGVDEEDDGAASDPDRVEVESPSDASNAPGVSTSEADEPGDPDDSPIKEASFSSDANGNGDVADLLGETLDKCAKAIDAMVLELDRTPSSGSSSGSSASSYVGVNDKADEDSVEEGSAGARETEGATILESTEDVHPEEVSTEAERSEEDWQVVTEDHQITSDEDLARAAQMIGSALFNSDMRSSTEMMSTMTGSAAESDAISFASSVPTSLPSVASGSLVASAQFNRWALQLEQLHALGIDDDAHCVDILERLTAANIGCGSFDEVSVQQVVNELWGNK